MNKEGFLKVLEERLSMLEEQERKDILSEYAMHIEMKRQSGMSEQEAIDDFGDVDSLIGEILEAYHIDPSYKGAIKKNPAGEIGRKAGDAISKSRRSFSHFMEQQKEKQEKKMEKRKQEEKERPSRWRQRTEEGREKKGDGEGVKNLCRGVWAMCKWIVVFFVKAVLLFLMIPAVIAGLMAVFALGILMILLVQGYPLIGVTLGIFGCVLSCGAYTFLIVSFLAEKRQKNNGKEVEA